MNCDRIENQLTGYLLGDLDEATSAGIREHLETCEGCRAFARDLEPTLDLLRDALAAPTEAPVRLTDARRDSILTTGPEPTTVAAPPTVERRPRFALWLGREHPILALAASLVLTAGFFWLLLANMVPGVKRASAPPEVAVAMRQMERLPMLMEIEEDLDELEDIPVVVDGVTITQLAVEDEPPDVAWFGASGGRDEVGMSAPRSAEVASPVVMKGLHASRSGGGRAQALSDYRRKEADDKSGMTENELKSHEEFLGRIAGDSSAVTWEAEGIAPGAKTPAAVPAPLQPKPESAGIVAGAYITGEVAGGAGNITVVKEASVKSSEVHRGRAEERRALREDAQAAPAALGFEVAGKLYGVAGSGAPADEEARPAATAAPAKPAEPVPAGGDRFGYYQMRKARERGETSDSDDFVALGELREQPAPLDTRKRVMSGPVTGPEEGAAVSKSEAVAMPDAPSRAKGDVTLGWTAPVPSADPLSRLEQSVSDVAGLKREVQNGAIVLVPDNAPEGELFAEPKDVPDGDGDESDEGGPRFKAVGVNPFVMAAEQAFSTFSIDVDTAAYTLSRRYMTQGVLPPAEAVRTEEFVNFFDYGYPPPVGQTFKVYSEMAPSRFGRGLHLLKIGVKGKRLGREEQRRAVLTFLIDTSGSMEKRDRIGLIKHSLRLLTGKLNPQDRIAIVQYGSQARLVLEHTPASDKERILAALDELQCSGSTNLEEGMRRAYRVAGENFKPGGENRVLLLSDGAANLGALAAEDILSQVERYRKQGVYCSVFGFGTGTYNDTMLEELADKGNGSYRFIDSEEEARRVFVEDLAATLNTIASDVKIQVEFNPQLVRRYRQLGYENRQLRKEDFRNDAVDAGEVGSGQSVTALYEVELAGEAFKPHRAERVALSMVGTVRVRYRRTDNAAVEEIQHPVTLSAMTDAFEKASPHFRLAACAAEFSEILRGSPFSVGSDTEDVSKVLRPVALDLTLDTRVQELLGMVQSANGMTRGGY